MVRKNFFNKMNSGISAVGLPIKTDSNQSFPLNEPKINLTFYRKLRGRRIFRVHQRAGQWLGQTPDDAQPSGRSSGQAPIPAAGKNRGTSVPPGDSGSRTQDRGPARGRRPGHDGTGYRQNRLGDARSTHERILAVRHGIFQGQAGVVFVISITRTLVNNNGYSYYRTVPA